MEHISFWFVVMVAVNWVISCMGPVAYQGILFGRGFEKFS